MSKSTPNSKGLYRKTFYYMGKKYDITAKDEKTLMRKVVEKQIELESGNVVMNKSTTVARWCDEWLEVYKKPKVQAKHYSSLESICRLHIKLAIDALKLIDVKRVNLQKILNSHEGKSFSFVTKIRSTLYDIFNSALENELINKNPAQNLDLPNYQKGESVAFTDAEYEACLDVSKTHPAGLWILVMLTCGLRPQETVPLMWSDVDLTNRTIDINKAVDLKKNQPILKGTKSIAGGRVVPICDELHAKLKDAPKDTLYVFTKETGGLMSVTRMRNMWSSFTRKLDIHMGAKLYRNAIVESKLQQGLSPYSCRHTCITRLVLSGLDVKTVQVFAGHETAETTLKYYTHLDKYKAAQRVLEFRNGGSNSGSENKNVAN